MKQIASALVKSQKAKDVVTEAALLKQMADLRWPLRKVNAASASPMPNRFIEKVIFGASDCWVWRGHVDAIGYGRFHYMGENKAHRVSHILFKGEVPDGMFVLHKCDNRQCVNPDHLFLGTQSDNMRDMVTKGRGHKPDISGTKNPMAKLDAEKVKQIRRMVASGSKQIDACRAFGVSPMTVSRIIRGEAWK